MKLIGIKCAFAVFGLSALMVGVSGWGAQTTGKSVQAFNLKGERVPDADLGNDRESQFSGVTMVRSTEDENKIYLSGVQLRSDRIVGAGLSIGGLTGYFGGHIDMNLDEENAVWVGIGKGSGYTAVSLDWKRNFEGTYLTPYVKAGVTTWFNSSGAPGGANESIILKEFLTRAEMNSGKYSLSFVNSAIGAQYNQLSGDWKGITLFAEAIMMMHPETMRLVPNGTLGTTYYF